MNRGIEQNQNPKAIGNTAKNLDEIKKVSSISNAFNLEIKNQREEALKNLEQLRKSVKFAKRANPMEKIMSKLIGSDSTIS